MEAHVPLSTAIDDDYRLMSDYEVTLVNDNSKW